MSERVRYVNASIFTADAEQPTARAFVTDGAYLAYLGDTETARERFPEADEVDLDGASVLPGFVDGHAHILGSGEAQLRAALTDAADLPEIQRRIGEWAARNPERPRVLGQGWLFDAIPEGRPHKAMLDAVVPDRPAYLDANDLHSVWVNSAALAELGITAATPDPSGGSIERDPETGEPSGHLTETAALELVGPFLDGTRTDADRDRALGAATEGYLSTGTTAAVDMALDETSLATMVRAEQTGELQLRITAHWLINRSGDPLAQINRAAELAKRHHSDRLRVTGVKFIVDGVIDGHTACLLEPYADGETAEPIWDAESLTPAVVAADAAGLQIALHAIGDKGVRIALDALAAAVSANGDRPRRHRIEHLEYMDRADIPRLAELGVIASMQPVHADPAIRPHWDAMLGNERAQRGFAWPEMTAAGARLVFGTDTPTAPHQPLPNMFIASTRRSALRPELPARQPHFALPVAEAITHGTADSAWACRAESVYGRLRAGLLADFIVLDRDPFSDPEAPLHAGIRQTVLGGRTVWRAE